MVAKRRIFIWVPKHYEKKLEIAYTHASKSHLLRGGYPTCKLAKAEKVGNENLARRRERTVDPYTSIKS